MEICNCEACATLQSLALIAYAMGDRDAANRLAGKVTCTVDDHVMSLAEYYAIQAFVAFDGSTDGYSDAWTTDETAWFQRPISGEAN